MIEKKSRVLRKGYLLGMDFNNFSNNSHNFYENVNRELILKIRFQLCLQVSTVADESARCAASRRTCCKQRWTL